MAGAIRCLLVRVERLERQLADASGCSKERRTGASDSSGSVVDTLVSLDRSLQVEWLDPVRVEPQEIVLPIKDETHLGCSSISRRDSGCGDADPA